MPLISMDLQTDDVAMLRARQEEADRKRMQNTLPIWYQKSAIGRGKEIDGDAVNEKEVKANEEQDTTDKGDAIDIDSLVRYYANYQPEADGDATLGIAEENFNVFNWDGEVDCDAMQMFDYQAEMWYVPGEGVVGS
ncbi:hypothetical protein BC938DRAFT_479873 [Jimgerdemannia flammicorona]|uniref:Uncharacterized protein n=1 Tax=Jimgerdemannia flammicorona TaxID=994334 RepID=A0A433QXV2_9FUNG|nr:hypothetical protein BC938DRAFT_479873 [Jimgerdemannia flammicorona]